MILDTNIPCLVLLSLNNYNFTLGFGVIGCLEQLIIFNQVSLLLPETNHSDRKSISCTPDKDMRFYPGIENLILLMISYPGCHVRATYIGCIGTHAHGRHVKLILK